MYIPSECIYFSSVYTFPVYIPSQYIYFQVHILSQCIYLPSVSTFPVHLLSKCIYFPSASTFQVHLLSECIYFPSVYFSENFHYPCRVASTQSTGLSAEHPYNPAQPYGHDIMGPAGVHVSPVPPSRSSITNAL